MAKSTPLISLPQASIALTDWGSEVYPPSDDSFALVDALAEHLVNRTTPTSLCLEIGCGSGFVVTSLALMLKSLEVFPHIIATDINPAAGLSTATTLSNHNVKSVDVVLMDLVGGFAQRWFGKVDILLFNPPYVPTPHEEVGRNGIARAWAGGAHGREVIDRLLPLISKLLAPGGDMFMVTVAENRPEGIVKEMEGYGLKAEVVLIRTADEERLHILRIGKGGL
ncbi:hypothetical protein BSKO_07557 [Bryopsis sp. KO-2023]|nr:hypothetical protein BSKO_07557 [Bryopsis sp. KO-2023]